MAHREAFGMVSNTFSAEPPDPLEKLIDVARELGCSTWFLRDEAKRGRLKITKLSTQILRIRRSEKLRYLAACEADGAAA